jgi:hypothetical protein
MTYHIHLPVSVKVVQVPATSPVRNFRAPLFRTLIVFIPSASASFQVTTNKVSKHLPQSVPCPLSGAQGNLKETRSVFWVVSRYSLVEVYRRFRATCCLSLQGDDAGGNKHVWSNGKLLGCKEQQPKRHPSSYSPPWEPKNLTCEELLEHKSVETTETAWSIKCSSQMLLESSDHQ